MSIDAPIGSKIGAGHLIARRLRASGIDTIFTLSGGHLFSIYDGCRAEGVRLIDTRHEQTAAFAAEGWSKVTRVPGVAALTAGPGVTNGMSAMAAAQQNQSPLLVLGGRAPALRWGQGSLQEIDHVPFVAPLTRFAATAGSADAVGGLIDDALRATVGAGGRPTGVAFVDFPMDHVFGEAHDAGGPGALAVPQKAVAPDGESLGVAADLLAGAQRPVIMAGTNVWWGHAETALLSLAEALRIPVLMNGMARGTVPADHELAFSRARSKALKEADVALVVGVPMDFRLGFGGVFGARHPAGRRRSRRTGAAASPRGRGRALRRPDHDLVGTGRRPGPPTMRAGSAICAPSRSAGRAAEQAELTDDRSPLHPMRVYAELKPLLDRDAIVVIDAGDFGSYAGRVIDSYVPGAWLDSGPFGCLGSGPGYALAAKLARPDRQVVLLQGDGAFGFSGMEWDTLVRHGVHVVSVIGNNGIWALEKHPMEMLYGYSVVAELRPGTRYDEVVTALGGHGELVSTPAELRPALERAFASGLPAVVNTLTDPQSLTRVGRIWPEARERGNSLDAFGLAAHAEGMEVLHDSSTSFARSRNRCIAAIRSCNTIELTLLRADRFRDDSLLLTVSDDGVPVGAALQTPPYPLACNGIPVSASRWSRRDLARRRRISPACAVNATKAIGIRRRLAHGHRAKAGTVQPRNGSTGWGRCIRRTESRACTATPPAPTARCSSTGWSSSSSRRSAIRRERRRRAVHRQCRHRRRQVRALGRRRHTGEHGDAACARGRGVAHRARSSRRAVRVAAVTARRSPPRQRTGATRRRRRRGAVRRPGQPDIQRHLSANRLRSRSAIRCGSTSIRRLSKACARAASAAAYRSCRGEDENPHLRSCQQPVLEAARRQHRQGPGPLDGAGARLGGVRREGRRPRRRAAAKAAQLLNLNDLAESEDIPQFLAIAREASERTTTLRPFDVQLLGALRMLAGDVVEMATGEGKTLSGAIAAAGYALGGPPCARHHHQRLPGPPRRRMDGPAAGSDGVDGRLGHRGFDRR